MMKHITLTAQIPAIHDNKRLDKTLAQLFPAYSRSQLKQWIDEGTVKVNDQVRRPRDKVRVEETIVINATLVERGTWEAENISLNIIYEDDDLIIINKPAGLVVHPAAGNYQGTLVNALLFYCPQLKLLPRGGLIHRLDKDTSGLLMIAKTLGAHTSLVSQLQERTVKRYYFAIVYGVLTGGGTINQPIGRHPKHRTKMAIVHSGKPAITHYRIKERFSQHTCLSVKLDTGRTHQIRVHLAAIHHPVLGDNSYGRHLIPKGASDELKVALKALNRQLLHAESLVLAHPSSGEPMTFTAPLPPEIIHVADLLRKLE